MNIKDIVRLKSDWGFLFYGAILLAILLPPVTILATEVDTYVLKDPTQEQMLTIIEGSSQDRVWYNGARYILGGSSLVEVDLRTRTFEDSRADKFLDEVGVEYIPIEKRDD